MNLSPTLPEVPETFVASLAHPADGFLDLGRMGLVLEPLIQGACHRAHVTKIFLQGYKVNHLFVQHI